MFLAVKVANRTVSALLRSGTFWNHGGAFATARITLTDCRAGCDEGLLVPRGAAPREDVGRALAPDHCVPAVSKAHFDAEVVSATGIAGSDLCPLASFVSIADEHVCYAGIANHRDGDVGFPSLGCLIPDPYRQCVAPQGM